MKIGILQTGHSPEDLYEPFGDYDGMFRGMLDGKGFEFQTWAVVDGIFPDGPQDADGWLITGSRHGAYEDHAWIPPLEDLIRAIHASKQPLAGICFGHQIIAQALGGKVAKFEGGWAVGRVTYQTQDGPLTLNAWHQDQVVELPEGARVLGGNDFCRNGILAYGDHIISWQPHPEFPSAFVGGLIEKRGRGVVPDEVLDRAAAGLDAPVDNQNIATFLAEFYRKERT
ncbi:type 1 glutamine amidotransferase [Leisingera aquaemixtae]|mgnify:FL=1|jgi:GMP synthase (glutamine-hydrolysing)|uniref:Amidotransferase n=1 Tax=Leisingera aquaemixtae TaxID=1396826 RepID=A0A0P1HE12_9RHOB|nr:MULTISPECIES: type 1 glutamine amidotransferase [Leisingera]QDI76223.1 type 1 glutamine amidotransferase [Leisingera aquaemixtae]UWQ26103.1 type 1 glutamine amidotransferase [Leisingera aquaemixtae]UWQ38624.1 type 1 glutamine amidotransferase [Leisingera aquaemixtae]UWQ42725.1 type 1 glutamine amidotransferase [Leisingera aquaemixtae]UWQ47029.1 type 1 glutamine amidotransferase [Leisingera aquaemixtae]